MLPAHPSFLSQRAPGDTTAAARLSVAAWCRPHTRLTATATGTGAGVRNQGQQAQSQALQWRAVQPNASQPMGRPSDLAAIVTSIKAARTWQQLQNMYTRCSGFLNHVHISAMITHMAHLSRRTDHSHAFQQYDRLASNTTASTSTSSSTAPAPSTPPQQPHVRTRRWQHQPAQPRFTHSAQDDHTGHMQFVSLLLKTMAKTISTYQFRQLANTMWAVAKLEAPAPGAWVNRCMSSSIQKLPQAKPQELANMLYAVALRPEWLTSVNRSSWLELLLKQCQPRLTEFKPQELSNLLWAAATLHTHQRLPAATAAPLTAALQQAAVRAERFNPQEVSNVLWAAAKLTGQPGLLNSPSTQQRTAQLLGPCSQAVLKPLLLRVDTVADAMEPAAAASVVLSIAWLGIRPSRQWIATLLDRWQPSLPQFGPGELAVCLLGLAYLGYQPSDGWSREWLRHTARQLGGFGSQQLAMVAWALHRLDLQPPDRFVASMRLMCADKLFSFSAVELAILSQSLVTSQYRPDEAWMRLLLLAVRDKLSDTTPQQLAVILSHVSQLTERPPATWVSAVLAHLQPHLESMGPQALTMTIYSLAKLGTVPDRAWCVKFLSASIRHLRTANVRDLSSLLWGMVMLDMRPDKQWLQEYSKHCSASLQTQVAAYAQVAAQLQAASDTDTASFEGAAAAGVQPGRAGTGMASARHESSATAAEQDHQEEALGGSGSEVGLVWHEALPPRMQQAAGSVKRGGALSNRMATVVAVRLWEPISLQRTTWALARLGYAADHPLMQLCTEAMGVLHASLPWTVREEMLEVIESGSGGALGTQGLGVKEPGAAAAAEGVSAAVRRLAASETGEAGVVALDTEALVLQGMLSWAAKRLHFAVDESSVRDLQVHRTGAADK